MVRTSMASHKNELLKCYLKEPIKQFILSFDVFVVAPL